MAEDKAIGGIDAGKAAAIVRAFLEDNFGNIGMLLYRVESVQPNIDKDKFIVLTSLLSSVGSSKRLYYKIKVNVANGEILEIWKGEESKDDSNRIILRKVELEEE